MLAPAALPPLGDNQTETPAVQRISGGRGSQRRSGEGKAKAWGPLLRTLLPLMRSETSAQPMKMGKVLEQLSSGYRINRAADDAAGLGISEKMRAQIRGNKQAIRNAQDGISMLQTAEGAMDEVHSMLQRMRELAVQGANDTSDTRPRPRWAEIVQLRPEIDRIAGGTTFNGQNLLTGTLSGSLGGAQR